MKKGDEKVRGGKLLQAVVPNEPDGGAQPDLPKLIDLPPLPEPQATAASADWPAPRATRESYSQRRRKRRQIIAIATGTSIGLVTATILYLFLGSLPDDQRRPSSTQVSDGQPLAPADPASDLEIPASTPAATPSPRSTTAVRAVLDEYRVAIESLRPEAVQAVWPAANTVALARSFDRLESQSLDLDHCAIEVGATGAEATCTGRVTIVQKVGDRTPHVESHRWKFYLRGRSERWTIDRVVSR